MPTPTRCQRKSDEWRKQTLNCLWDSSAVRQYPGRPSFPFVFLQTLWIKARGAPNDATPPRTHKRSLFVDLPFSLFACDWVLRFCFQMSQRECPQYFLWVSSCMLGRSVVRGAHWARMSAVRCNDGAPRVHTRHFGNH